MIAHGKRAEDGARVVVEKREFSGCSSVVRGDHRHHAEITSERVKRDTAHAAEGVDARIRWVEIDLKTFGQRPRAAQIEHLNTEGRWIAIFAIWIANVNAGDRKVVGGITNDLDAALLGAIGESESIEKVERRRGIRRAQDAASGKAKDGVPEGEEAFHEMRRGSFKAPSCFKLPIVTVW